VEKQKPGPKPKGQKRVFKGTQEIHHDLFKLKVATMLKRKPESWGLGTDELDKQDMLDVEHVHFFHSVDSDGKVQTNCSTIGGHFHIMEVAQGADGVPVVKCGSGPMHFARKKVRGKMKRVMIPVNEVDDHTHDVQYIESMTVKRRKLSAEAANVVAHDAQKTAPIPGVA